ncbi:hypothetical protein QJS10_CPA02g01412 [Acorus calamus]|uniref:Uncharacterized protein n=1 Tax=Acorus calamus TaxID=4465 RepID=A0AAV9FG39_ACOCL|nr:hypothetical protein QJS10_CPA02g01412 [Acorus calamus]
MDKRTPSMLRVKKRPLTKRSGGRFAKALVRYLTSDSYMYAPLVSPPSDSISPSKIRSSAAPPSPPEMLFPSGLDNGFKNQN